MEILIGILIQALTFVIFLGILVFVHEFGHFVVAKLMNIYVFEFMLGFPPKIFRIKRKETEYGIGMIPLGGYVKMAGQEDFPGHEEDESQKPDINVPEDRKFNSKKIWQRMAVIVAGPFANLVFGALVFILLFVVGHKVDLGVEKNFIGFVREDSPAQKAGIKVGDRISSVNGAKTETFSDIRWNILSHVNEEIEIGVERDKEFLLLRAVPEKPGGKEMGGVGIGPFHFVEIKRVDEGSPAEKAGAYAGDIIFKVNNEYAQYFDVYEKIGQSGKKGISLVVLRDGMEKTLRMIPEEVGNLDGVLIRSDNVIIVSDDKKANKAFKTGDKILSFGGVEVSEKENAVNLINFFEGDEAEIVLLRKEKTGFIKMETREIRVVAEVSRKGLVGISYSTATTLEKYPLPKAISKGLELSASTLKMVVGGIVLLFKGKIGTDQMAGPVGIFKMTSMAASQGFSSLLRFLGLLSMALAFFNILPLPILDGGHVFLLLIEKIKGSPIKEKYIIAWQKVGIVLIISLLLFVTFNDVRWRIF